MYIYNIYICVFVCVHMVTPSLFESLLNCVFNGGPGGFQGMDGWILGNINAPNIT